MDWNLVFTVLGYLLAVLGTGGVALVFHLTQTRSHGKHEAQNDTPPSPAPGGHLTTGVVLSGREVFMPKNVYPGREEGNDD